MRNALEARRCPATTRTKAVSRASTSRSLCRTVSLVSAIGPTSLAPVTNKFERPYRYRKDVPTRRFTCSTQDTSHLTPRPMRLHCWFTSLCSRKSKQHRSRSLQIAPRLQIKLAHSQDFFSPSASSMSVPAPHRLTICPASRN